MQWDDYEYFCAVVSTMCYLKSHVAVYEITLYRIRINALHSTVMCIN